MDHFKPRIDIHAHYIPTPYRKMLEKRGIDAPDDFPLPKWDIPIQLERMERLNIVFAALTISSPHAHYGDAAESIEVVRASNEEGFGYAREYPDKLGILATLPLPEVEESISEIEFAVKEGALGFVMPSHAQGVYLGDERLEPVFDCLNKHKAVLHFHPTTPSAVPPNVLASFSRPILEFFFDTTRAITNMIANGVVRRYPDIKYVIPHGGAVLPLMADRMSGALARLDIDIFEVLRSFYYDLAGFVVPNQLEILKKTADLSKIVVGTDGPHTPVERARNMTIELDETDKLTDDERDAIYITNAKRLLAI